MIGAYLSDQILIVNRTVADVYGSMTEKKISVRGRIDFKTRMVRNIQGEMVVSSAKVTIDLRQVSHNDRVIYKQKEYSILNIEEVKDFSSKFLRLDLA